MSKEKKREEKNNLAIKRLVNIFNHSNISSEDVHLVLSGFLYSIGSAMIDEMPQSSEEILIKYAKEPTLGSALMAQAIHMKETWSKQGREEKEDDTG